MPNAAATAKRPASSCVTTNPVMARPCSNELISSVGSAPMRSAIAPQICRASTPSPSSTDSIAAPLCAEKPRSVQNATRWLCGIDMVTQHRNAAMASSANTTFGGQPSTRGVSPAAPAAPAEVCVSGGFSQEYQRQRNDHGGCEHAVGHHRGAPSEIGDGALEDRRPHRAGEIEPA